MRFRFGSFVCTSLFATACSLQSAALFASDQDRASDPPLAVYQRQVNKGDSYFALAVRLPSTVKAAPIRQHVVVVDTSASQFGEHRARSLDVLRGFLKSLNESDRVALYALDVQIESLTEGAVAPRSAACETAVETIANRVPLGATNLITGLQQASAKLDQNASILYIGDGMSASHLASAAELAKLTADLRARHIAVHSFAVGPRTDLEMLGVLAQQTGGVVHVDPANGKSDAHTGAALAAAAQAPIAYPTAMTIEPAGLNVLPATALPLRSDRATIYLGQGVFPAKASVSFAIAGSEQAIKLSLARNAIRPAQSALAALWKRAESTAGVGVWTAGTSMLTAAQESHEERLLAMLDASEAALASRDLAAAETIGNAVRDADPTNTRASTLLRAVDTVKQRDQNGKGTAVAQVETPPASPPAPAANRPAPPAASPLDPRRAIDPTSVTGKYRELMIIRGEQLTQEVNAAINAARKEAVDDPDAALLTLKRSEAVVQATSDVEPQIGDQLRRRLQTGMQEARAIREKQSVDKIYKAERLAQIEARRKTIDKMLVEEDRLEQLIDQVRALLVQATHGDDTAYENAIAVAFEAVKLRPGNGPAAQALFSSVAADHLNKARVLRALRNDRFLATLYQVELSHVPFADEPPILWPSATVWRALTERRKKWASVDLRSESKSEQRISEALDQTVDFEIQLQPLKDAIDFIKARYEIPIELDTRALDEAGVDVSQDVRANYPGIKLRNLFKLVLEQVNDSLTYVIEDEVMKITTVERAQAKPSIRIYPIGDIILGPRELAANAGSGGGIGGGGGGFGGGQGGGQGGGGFGGGGQGGGGFGGGGGQFSVPAESFPSTPATLPASKSTGKKKPFAAR